MTTHSLDDHILAPDASLSDALTHLSKRTVGILLICDADRHLLGVITDGDIRKALIRGAPMHQECSAIMNKNPVFVQDSHSTTEMLDAMNVAKTNTMIYYAPILDANKVVIGVASRKAITGERRMPMHAVIMAGGYGTRLAPMTNDVPKPMLKIGEQPLLELIVKQLVSYGIHDITMTTHYLPDIITDHFQDGGAFDANITYTHEEEPLGTAGALSMVHPRHDDILVMNGDILTNLNFAGFLHYHHAKQAKISVAVRDYDINIPYGVLDMDKQSCVEKLVEKPTYKVHVNAGIYILNSKVLGALKAGAHANMTDLIDIYHQDKAVFGFPIHEYWMDIGQHQDYSNAQKDYAEVFK